MIDFCIQYRILLKKGETRYDCSEAQKCLKQAAKEGKTQDKTPLHLKENILFLQSFTLKQIASHKNWEERYQKEGVYWQKEWSDKAKKDTSKDRKEKKTSNSISLFSYTSNNRFLFSIAN